MLKTGFTSGRMSWAESFRVGIQGLIGQKLRSFLTMLGVIFGVAAVVSMQSIGAGARQELLNAIKLLGVNNVIVQSQELKDDELKEAVTTNPKQLHPSDAEALRNILDDVERVIPVRRKESYIRIPEEFKIEVVGTEPDYLEAQNLVVVDGRFLKKTDSDGQYPVVVITGGVKHKLFPLERAIGKKIKINKEWFTVIGVAETPTSSSVSNLDIRDMSTDVYIPLETMESRFVREEGESQLQEIILQVSDENLVGGVSIAAGKVMQRRHRGAEDYKIVVPIELLKQSQQTQRIFNVVMGAIASISLLVGGIGIMNIMLSNVLERTREIGVRRAVGAREQDVVLQFLIEAVLLSFIGGTIGVILGALMAWSITLYAGWTTLVGVGTVTLAFGVSAGVGILFGWWPARKAAKMNVINALRYE